MDMKIVFCSLLICFLGSVMAAHPRAHPADTAEKVKAVNDHRLDDDDVSDDINDEDDEYIQDELRDLQDYQFMKKLQNKKKDAAGHTSGFYH